MSCYCGKYDCPDCSEAKYDPNFWKTNKSESYTEYCKNIEKKDKNDLFKGRKDANRETVIKDLIESISDDIKRLEKTRTMLEDILKEIQ